MMIVIVLIRYIIHSTRRARVMLSNSLTLLNVLYVPNLHCNLISISQLLAEHCCDIVFTHNLCFVQDRSARMVIGAGERRDGLYYFCEVAVTPTTSLLAIQTAHLELWHSRLGDPFEAVLKSLPFISSSTSDLNKSCDTCHRAKHTRDVFFDNFKKATHCF
ncbi:hypothetical protein LIER_00816 [Lithospermum erythrorhizon]|uniref:GAG-pre-integrase domain-containing protein n=1 Tax=Lithospermum erythrorhizon TaxID=34254 RepID=A0AAV3NJV9_LITER